MTPFRPGDNVFQTQADQRFNSFASPLNAVNSNPGDWGIDAAYLTPSYMSPYRPRYQGPQGTPMGSHRPGFFQSANHIFNPFEGGGTNYGGNTYQQNTSYYDAIGLRPSDGTMNVAQNFIFPVAAGIGAFSAFSKVSGRLGSSVGSNFARGMMGGTFSAGATATGMRIAGGLGAFAGSMALPLAVTQAAVSAADALVFDPYTSQRQAAGDLRRNLFGISYGNMHGNQTTGGGISRAYAASLGTDVAKAGSRDVTFSQREMAQLADYSSRSGLLDNVSSSQITSRLEAITKQVKVIMAVANTSDFKEAIEMVSKLQHSGASYKHMNSTVGAIGGLASAAGMSTQGFMNTIGAQGQYLYQANGLTPYVGQLTAGQAAASFATAYRSGLMSPALMARMGGVEGAAQSANAGLLASLQSPYSMIAGMNAFSNGGAGGGVVGNMTRFGGSLAGNALEGIGQFNLLRPSLVSQMAEQGGVSWNLQRLKDIGSVNPLAMRRNGTMAASSAYMILTQQLGLTDDQARATLEQIRAVSDPGARNMANAGFDRQQQDFFMKFADQNSMNKGIFTTPYNAVANAGRAIQEQATGIMGMFSRMGANISDGIENFMYGGMYGMNRRNGELSATDFIGGSYGAIGTVASDKSLMAGLSGYSPSGTAVASINNLLASNDATATNILIDAQDGNIRRSAMGIQQLANEGKINQMYAKGSNAAKLVKEIQAAGTIKRDRDNSGAVGRVKNAIEKITGKIDEFAGAEVIALVEKIKAKPLDDDAVERLAELTGEDFSNPDNLKKFINKTTRESAIYGGYSIDEVFESLKTTSDVLNKEYDEGGFEALSKKYLGGRVVNSKAEFLAVAANRMNMNILERGLDPSKTSAMSDEQAQAYIEGMSGIRNQRSMLERAAKSNFIDFSQYTSSQSALDNKEAALKFSASVDQFGSYVQSIVSGKPIGDLGNKKGNDTTPRPVP